VGITAHEATITLRIVARGADEAACLAKIAPTEALIRAALGDLVYGVEDDEIEDAALAAVAQAGSTLATAEIATCGQIAALFAAAEARGRRAGLRRGLVLPESDAAAALPLAERVRQETGATYGLGVGPIRAIDGVELIEIGLVGPEGVQRVEHRLGGAGTVRMSRAAKTAIDLVRKTVQLGASASP
jgi:nicotinamide-nucleotide amidase